MTILATPDFCRVTRKKYADATITPGQPPLPADLPGSAGGQIMRYTGSTLQPARSNFQSNERTGDLQVSDVRMGGVSCAGTISGELSPGAFQDEMAAVFRNTWTAGVALDDGDLTSLAAVAADFKFTVGGGDPIALGLRVGTVFRLDGLTETAGNNGRNFIITGFGGVGNVDINVYPAPLDMDADATFNLVVPGKRLLVPSSGFVLSKFLYEHYFQDTDSARAFLESRAVAYSLAMPAEGACTTGFDIMSRDFASLDGGDAPFFAAPTAATTAPVCDTIAGALIVNGVAQAVVTGANLKFDTQGAVDKVAFSKWTPEIFTKRMLVTGDVTFDFTGNANIGNFMGGVEGDLILMLTNSEAPDSEFVAKYLPRYKFTAAQMSEGNSFTEKFNIQALKKPVVSGYDATSAVIQDSLAI